jgi:hypothetical protein
MHPPLTHIERILKAEALKNDDPELPQERIPLRDQRRILATDIRGILAGRTEIYDDRQPRGR